MDFDNPKWRRELGNVSIDPPSDPLPWSDEVNDLYLRLTHLAWVDLHTPDPPLRVVDGKPTLAAQALEWFESGGMIQYPTRNGRARSVSLFEVWGWDLPTVVKRAREVYAARTPLAVHPGRQRPRSTLQHGNSKEPS